MSRCTKTKQCLSIREFAEIDAHPRQKGLIVLNLKNIKTGKSRQLLAYRRAYKDAVAFNFCPWCGVNIENGYKQVDK